ncbi:MAG TPA: L-aspartate oxidase [Candidatus Hypogeohydataceae bacterium YC41]
MYNLILPKRYVVGFDTTQLPELFTEVLVIGSGVAGLSAALEASRERGVLIVSKNKLGENNTMHAQGGVAVVLSPEDSFQSHIKDTLEAGQGLCDRKVVEKVVRDGPSKIEGLLELGASFDRVDSASGELAFTKEGGHSHRRVIHGRGDSTGMVVEEALLKAVEDNVRISTMDHCFAIDLLVVEGACRGALLWHKQRGRFIVWAGETILATGGCGQLYRETTNSAVATGDGMAMAYRAGAVLQDMEFVQFHPTTLYIAGAARVLITEAMRGEGAILRNKWGERFMPKYHPMAELAPRDVVSKSILQEMQDDEHTHVYLDVTHLPKEYLESRFPNICSICASFHIDITKELIPVRPSAHYMIGGAKVDNKARTGIPHLYACGETACTGLHGANRLGSNSLLEGLVYGYKAGEEVSLSLNRRHRRVTSYPLKIDAGAGRLRGMNLEDIRDSLKSLMWRCAGVERDEEHLKEAEDALSQWREYVMDKEFHTAEGWELQNMLLVSSLIVMAAQQRKESRGVHYRKDYAQRDDQNWKRHITFRGQGLGA